MVRLIAREELKAKIDRGEAFKLVMVMNERHFEAAHIPGSILVANREDASKKLRPDDMCSSSQIAADRMERAGFLRVLHHKGGLKDWSAAGYPLEGSSVQSRAAFSAQER